MKKNRCLIVAVLGFILSITTPSYSGQKPVDQSSYGTTADIGVDEQVFVNELNDENTQLYSQMSPEKKREAMDMTQMMDATGVLLSPNQAVSKVASTDISEKNK
jgi:hypothetical protein